MSFSYKVSMFTTYSAVTAAAGGRRRIRVRLHNMLPSLLAALTKVKMQQYTQISDLFAVVPDTRSTLTFQIRFIRSLAVGTGKSNV